IVAKLTPQDLPAGGLGELVHELDLSRVLVGSHPLLAERDQRLFGHRLPALEADECLDSLAAVLVGNADDRRLLDRLVAVEPVLDVTRPDLVPGGVDLVLLAVDEVEPALLVHEPYVAGV